MKNDMARITPELNEYISIRIIRQNANAGRINYLLDMFLDPFQ